MWCFLPRLRLRGGAGGVRRRGQRHLPGVHRPLAAGRAAVDGAAPGERRARGGES